jgi:23S rRNA (cytosine1962-C5)-methyltransferase
MLRPPRDLLTLTPEWTDYELLDTGNGKKLERFGEFTLIRPEPQANWPTNLASQKWESAHAEFVAAVFRLPAKAGGRRSSSQPSTRGEWKFRKPLPDRWPMHRKNLKFWVQPAPSGHVGVFPDQACHWDWIAEQITRATQPPKILSLFAHTGLSTLAAAAAGAHVTHVDASRKAVNWARENQALSQLTDRPIRWIVEDALTFVQREARRGNQYQAIILDPPQFGRGPDGQIWKLHDSLPELLAASAKVLSPSPFFVLLNIYTTVLTQSRAHEEAEALRTHLKQMFKQSQPTISAGELLLHDSAHRKISSSVFARYQTT